jgi:hypothetical protein
LATAGTIPSFQVFIGAVNLFSPAVIHPEGFQFGDPYRKGTEYIIYTIAVRSERSRHINFRAGHIPDLNIIFTHTSFYCSDYQVISDIAVDIGDRISNIWVRQAVCRSPPLPCMWNNWPLVIMVSFPAKAGTGGITVTVLDAETGLGQPSVSVTVTT